MFGRLSYTIAGDNPAGRWKLRYNRDGSEADYVLVFERRLGLFGRLRSLLNRTAFKEEHRELSIPFDYVEGASEAKEGMARRFTFYRQGVQVGKVYESTLSDEVLEEIEGLLWNA